VPEMPQMQALAERVEAWLGGATFEGYEPLGFSGLKTAVPSPDELVGRTLSGVGRRAKYQDSVSAINASGMAPNCTAIIARTVRCIDARRSARVRGVGRPDGMPTTANTVWPSARR